MITVVGGFVKVVNQSVEVTGNEMELKIYAKMFYATKTAKDELDKKLFHLNYYDRKDFNSNDDDVRIKTMTIEPFEEETNK